MKRIYIIFLLSFSLFSCEKLDQAPRSTVGKDAIFVSENGLALYSNSFYNILPTASDIVRGDAMSDYIARKEVPDFIRPGAYGPRQSTGWNWDALRNINYFIQNNNKSSIPEETRNHYMGIARFFRAWFYFDKVKRFGDVPWINKPFDVNDTDLFNGRDPRKLVMDSVLQDLDFAIKHIRTTNDGTRSMITKPVAYAFKSRVCLFEGTFRKYHTSYNLSSTADEWLTQAANAANAVMEDYSYSLHTSGSGAQAYRQLFVSKSPVTNEVLLANVYDDNLALYHDANWYWTSATYGDRANFTRSFINTYLNLDGTPFTNNAQYETMEFSEEVKNRDLRLSQTIRTKGYTRINGGTVVASPPVFSYTYTGYQPIKWTLDDMFYDSGSRNDNILPVIRYGEVLLNYAEAKAELGTLNDLDWSQTIGALRRRAGIVNGTSTMPTAVDPYLQREYFPEINNPALLEVRRERGIELALEGFRFYDLVRWNKGKLLEKVWNGMYVPSLDTPLDLNEDGVLDVVFFKTMPGTPIPGVTYINVSENINGRPNPLVLSQGDRGEIIWLNTIPRTWNDRFYLYPIPEAERLINPALGQNPGW